MSRHGWSNVVFLRAIIVVFLISSFMTKYVYKRKGDFAKTEHVEALMPAKGKIEDIDNEKIEGSEFVTEETYRKITWITTIIAIIMFSIF